MTKERIFVFIAYFALAFIAYRNCFDIFIPGDNYSYLYMFEIDGVGGILWNARKSAPYFVAYPILYFLYQMFGINAFCWTIAAIVLHVLNSFFVFLITKRLVKIVFADEKIMIAFFSGLLFLISPYQTEEVLWALRWTFHATITLAGIYLTINYLTDNTRKQLLAIQFFFLLGLFSNEPTFVMPLISTVFFVLFRKLGPSSLQPKKFFTHMILPQVMFLFGYFVVCKLVSGHWFFHGGTMGDIAQTTDYLKTLLKYFAKFLIFYRHIPFGELDELLRSFSKNQLIIILSGLLGLVIGGALLWRIIKRKREAGYVFTALLACFVIFLLPVLPLDSSFLKYIYPDRYGYLPSVFFYMFLTMAVYFLFKKFALPVLAGYSLLCWIFLAQTISAWSASNEHCNALTENYKSFEQYDRVYILNVPAYYQGVAAFRSAFAETVYMKNNSPAEKIRVISGCYQEFAADTLTSVTITGNMVTVSGPKNETPYFSTDGGWARSYKTREYEVIFDPTGCSYTLIFKEQIPANSAFIYTSLGTWKKAG